MRKSIVVLGPNGMLGQMVVKYFSERYDVIKFNKRYDISNRYDFLDELKQYKNSIIVNCIGKIKQKSDDILDLVTINSLLPLDIYNALDVSQILVHPSTDCVYSGFKKNTYDIDEHPDAIDEYGWSKRLGEQALIGKKNAYILRVSIIGPDFNSSTPSGLLGWFLSNPAGTTLKGFVNHQWNGITTLQWCKYLEDIILNDENLDQSGKVIQYGTKEIYSKFEMLKLFQKVYGTDYLINEFEDSSSINRSMRSRIECPDLETQLNELFNFTKANFN